jgi:hypothetical protein
MAAALQRSREHATQNFCWLSGGAVNAPSCLSASGVGNFYVTLGIVLSVIA